MMRSIFACYNLVQIRFFHNPFVGQETAPAQPVVQILVAEVQS